jgi:hypothetical protein
LTGHGLVCSWDVLSMVGAGHVLASTNLGLGWPCTSMAKGCSGKGWTDQELSCPLAGLDKG